MANSKISALTSATTPLAGTETLPIVQSSTTKQVSVANLTAGRSVTATNFIPSGSSAPTNGVYLPAANSVGIATNSNEALRVNANSQLLVSTTSTVTASDSVVQIKQTGNGSTNDWALGIDINSNNSSYGGIFSTITPGAGGFSSPYMVFRASSTNVGKITTDGSNTTYSTSSDYRLKNSIAPMTGALAKIALLKPVTYKWNSNGADGEGFIAHEIAEVVPKCVIGEKDAVDADGKPEYQGIDTSFLVATLVAAIQEQQTLIKLLEARLDAANL